MSREHVFVAMSGGVDSAVCAAKLIDAGYQVTGIHMTTWKDPKWEVEIESLPSPASLAKATADSLGIPFINLDVRDPFYLKVIQSFIEQYLAGQNAQPLHVLQP